MTLHVGQSQSYVDPKKEYTCQKGLLVVNRTQIHYQSLAAIICRGLSFILESEKATD